MLGQTTLGIGMNMFLRDQFSGPASKIRASAGMVARDFRKMQEEQLRHQRNLNAGLALAGAAALRGMSRGIKTAAKFGYEMEFVKSITQANVEEQKKLRAAAKGLAGQTMFYPRDLAEGMRFMAMAGMEVPQILDNITGAVNLAGATMSSLGGKGGAADIMTNVMKQFKVDFKYSTDVADQLSYAVTRSNTNLFDLGEALKYAGSTSMDLSVSLQESTAMVMALGNAGMQGSMAGVAMENSMRYMARAFSSFGSGTSKKALAELGLSISDVTDGAGNLISMTEVMKKMGQAIDQNFGGGMNLEKQATLQAIFGVRGKRAASLLLRNLKEFDKFTTDISTKSAGHASNIMGDMMQTLEGELMKLASQWQNFWESFTTAVGPTLVVVLKTLRGIGKALTWLFDKNYIGEFFAVGLGGFIAIRTVAAAYKAVVAGLRLIHMQMGGSFMTMAGQTVAGYSAMSGAAATYGRTAGLSMAGGVMGGRNTRLFKGTGGYMTRTAMGGTIMRKSMKASRFAAMGGVAAGRFAGRFAGRAAGAVGKRMIGPMLGRIVGILGGPWGMAISFILPGLIGMAIRAIKGNRNSTDDNTKALMDQKREMAMGGVQYAHSIQFLDDYGPKLQALAATSSGQTYSQAQIGQNFQTEFMDNVAKILQSGKMGIGGDLVINLDGDEVLRSPIEKYMENQIYNSGL